MACPPPRLIPAGLLISALVVAPCGAAVLTLPADAGAPAGGSTTVSLTVDDAGGILGADFTITYDPDVVLATSVAGTSLTSGQSLTSNLNVPGVVRVSLYGAFPLSGAGTLFEITFTSVGAPGMRTALDLAAIDLNEGGITGFGFDGAFCVRGRPAEVQGLRLGRTPGTTVAVLTWDPHPAATAYNVYRAGNRNLSDLACLFSGLAGATTPDDGAVPPLGGVLYYLVTASTCAGESTLGFGSSGTERLAATHCP
jgi:hypothetical protein